MTIHPDVAAARAERDRILALGDPLGRGVYVPPHDLTEQHVTMWPWLSRIVSGFLFASGMLAAYGLFQAVRLVVGS